MTTDPLTPGDSDLADVSTPADPTGPSMAGATRGEVVELAVPAATAYVSVLRSTAAALAARLDFTIDEIEDLRIAVDEASALLLAQALPESRISCEFRLIGSELAVSVTAESRSPRLPARDSFAWTVLTALAGEVDADVDPTNGRTTLTLSKRAEAVQERPSPLSDGAVLRDLGEARAARGDQTSETAE